jgi:hypothetical protein
MIRVRCLRLRPDIPAERVAREEGSTRLAHLEIFAFVSKELSASRHHCPIPYERGWPSHYNIPAGLKNVDVRRVQICVRKLAANSSDCGVSECTALPL